MEINKAQRGFKARGLTIVVLLLGSGHMAEAREGERGAVPDFETDVRPILKAQCFPCHGEEPKPKAHLDLRLARTIGKGGLSGAAVSPGSRDESLLWDRITADEMPPGDKKLTKHEKEVLGRWIDSGARNSRPEPASLAPGPVFSQAERDFWSFQPIKSQVVPLIPDNTDHRGPIDAFLLKKLREAGLTFSPEADRRTLIRRVSFDLHGLPPSPEAVAAFVSDSSPQAYELMIDRMLAAPAYGERWARHWLDIAGYAESDGNPSNDTVRPYAYKYRDYLIRAINQDRPWDELIREQLAGDELVTPPYEDMKPEDRDRLIATGFLRNAPDSSEEPGADAIQARDDVVAETVKIVSSSILGLTVGCAQCHSHRYDPITHEDYFRFRAVFEPGLDPSHWRTSTQRQVSLWAEAERKLARQVEAEIKEIGKRRQAKVEELVVKTLDKELAPLGKELQQQLRDARSAAPGKRTAAQKTLLKSYPRVLVDQGNVSLYDAGAYNAIQAEFDKQVTTANQKRPADDFVQAFTETPGTIPSTRLHFRGNPRQPKQAVLPGELQILQAATQFKPIAEDDPKLPTSGRRLAYARELTDRKHPLVARVFVNRVWMHHFGRGIVATPGDFGLLGERPTHPELLDWLADDFVSHGWKLKRFHKLLLTSAAYRQTSRRSAKGETIDPENRLLGRMSIRRLSSEEVRDAALAVSGSLNRSMFGPSVTVALDENGQVLIGGDTRDSAGRQNGTPKSVGEAANRRSIYIQVRRSLPLSFTEAFDPPTLTPNCDRRNSSTVATQSLALMNNEFVFEQATASARSLLKLKEPEARIRRAWMATLGREPSAEENSSAIEFVKSQRNAISEQAGKAKSDPELDAHATLVQALIGSNGFLYVD